MCKLLANGFEGPVQNFQCFQNLQTEPWNLTFMSYLLTNTHTIGFQIKVDDVRKFFETCDNKCESTLIKEILDNKL